MAKRRSLLSILYPAYNTVLFDGVPMWRAQAWALQDARLHGVKFTVNSAIRDNSIMNKWRGNGMRNLQSQQQLYDGWKRRLPGYFPANPPNRTSHAGFSDGNPAFHAAAGSRIPKYMWGIDAVNKPGGDAKGLVTWLNSHGYHSTRPYPQVSERHHLMFTKSPASNARKRLAAYYAKGK